ncbi:hypothetical protein OSB04_032106 [Centaurea solstitialis]|uniref:Uncharacterized protein n=1 Tax=Centaurea solstitialis TaxID=347529 RepID=A0AA38SIB2_9ASTR|nr:hypothetical protein OSB04_032106 [Centaurea solstitialis]
MTFIPIGPINIVGLLRCGKSCRLRWTNYLRPDIKRGPFSTEEEKLVIQLHAILGNRWAAIAAQLPGRTDNEIKNLWNTHLRKRLVSMGIDPTTHEPSCLDGPLKRPPASPSTRHMAQWETARMEAEARLSMESSTPQSLMSSPNKTTTATTTDYFLRVWHSEVGESFQNLNKGKLGCFSPASQPSVSGTTAETEPKLDPGPRGVTFYPGLAHVSSPSEMEDSSDTALHMFFDFPGPNELSFLEA